MGTPGSGGPGTADARPASSQIATAAPSSSQEIELPRSEGDLRETFDLPLMLGEAGGGSAGAARQTSDAVALFQDKPPPARRPTGAEARAKPRRCPTCGGFVPQGMSLCGTCGLDLDTGQRIDLVDDIDPVAPPRRSTNLPIGIAIVGGLTMLGSLLLAVFALMQYQNGLAGAELLGLVCAFGVFASVQFLRGKSIKLLVVALTLGAMIDVVALIALPVYHAQQKAAETVVEQVDDPDQTGVTAPITEALDMNRIWWGISLLLVYAATALYLNSPPVRRHFERRILAGPGSPLRL